jgi:hypothetical protein
VCAGDTFLLYKSTGKNVDVSKFHDSLGSKKDVVVSTFMTAVDFKGETIIACFHQSMRFGNTTKNYLIPPIQLWNYGIKGLKLQSKAKTMICLQSQFFSFLKT